jgi:hypothetical protein
VPYVIKSFFLPIDIIMKNILIVNNNNGNNGIDIHSKYISREIECDRINIKNDFNYDLLDKYKIVIWQNTMLPINQKKNNIFIYIVHTDLSYSHQNIKNIFKENDKHIDHYVFVSEEISIIFKNIIMDVNNYTIIQNKVDFINNDKNIEDGLCVSYGGYSLMKNHSELVKMFKFLENTNYHLEIYGSITDPNYYKGLQNLIISEKINNVKLFGWSENYKNRLKQSEFYFTSSKSEGCSYSLLEAIMLDKKIICSKQSCNFDKIKSYINSKVIGGTFLNITDMNFEAKKTKKDIYKYGTWENFIYKLLGLENTSGNFGFVLDDNIFSINIKDDKVSKYDFVSRQWKNQEIEGTIKSSKFCKYDRESIIALWNDENKNLDIHRVIYKNDKLIFEKIKTYIVNNLNHMTINKENNNLWLSVVDNLNLKLYCYENNTWEKNYRILYHNDKIIQKCDIYFDENQNLIFSLFYETEHIFIKNEDMYKLEEIL